jgi:glycosyltransferase involved in cell wall biosynthesis
VNILEISHFLAFRLYRRKLVALGTRHPLRVLACIPRGWQEDFHGAGEEETDTEPGYQLVARRTLFNWRVWGSKRFHLFMISPLLALDIRRFHPDVIAVDAEPYSLLAFETVLLRRAFAPSAKLVIHSSQNVHKEYPFPFGQIERFVLRQADAAVVRSETIRSVLRDKGMRRPIHVVPHGVDVQEFQPAPGRESSLHAGSLRIGYLGSLHIQKGVDVLLRAAAKMRQPAVVDVVGAGPELQSLKRLAAELRIGGQVRFRSSVPHTATPSVISAWDVLVLPSRTMFGRNEQFGRVLIEAMACGVPVVGSSCGEIPHVIGSAGCVFPESDAAALARILDDLAADGTRRRALAIEARRRAVACYSWDAVADRIAALYVELVCGSRS